MDLSLSAHIILSLSLSGPYSVEKEPYQVHS